MEIKNERCTACGVPFTWNEHPGSFVRSPLKPFEDSDVRLFNGTIHDCLYNMTGKGLHKLSSDELLRYQKEIYEVLKRVYKTIEEKTND
jgi:hypothetical protein